MDSDHGESATPVSTPRQWVVRRLDDGSLYTRPRSPCLWMRYMVDGKEQRESTGQTSLKAAEKILRARLDQVAADRLGARPFVGAIEHRVKVGELLDALETDYRLRR